MAVIQAMSVFIWVIAGAGAVALPVIGLVLWLRRQPSLFKAEADRGIREFEEYLKTEAKDGFQG